MRSTARKKSSLERMYQRANRWSHKVKLISCKLSRSRCQSKMETKLVSPLLNYKKRKKSSHLIFRLITLVKSTRLGICHRATISLLQRLSAVRYTSMTTSSIRQNLWQQVKSDSHSYDLLGMNAKDMDWRGVIKKRACWFQPLMMGSFVSGISTKETQKSSVHYFK